MTTATSPHQDVLDRYLEGHPKSPYSTYAKEFIAFVSGAPLDKAAVEAFIERKRGEGFKSQSLMFLFSVLRTLYHTSGLEWPFRKGEAPKFEYDDNAPAYDPRAVEKMIKTAVAGKYTEDEAYVLALITTYGLRREEIARLRKEHYHAREKILEIPRTKKGEPRQHLIPDEILPYVRAWGFKRSLTVSQVAAIWYRLLTGAGLPHVRGVGPHGVRRTLDTLLTDELGIDNTKAFFGWARRSSDMARRYYRTKFVGYSGEQVHQTRERREIDERVFRVHPFLPLWRAA